jgi:hypothetical protein
MTAGIAAERMTQVRRVAAGLMALCAALLSARPMHAQAPDDADAEWIARPFALEAQLGLGTPLGIAGIAADYSVLPWVSVLAGAGWGMGGVQLSVGSRARLLRMGRSRLTLQLDYSIGGAALSSSAGVGGGAEIRAERAHWLDAAVGVERRMASGVLARMYFGYSFLLGMNDWRCVETQQGVRTACSQRPADLLIGPGVFTFGLSAGYAF